MIDRLLADPLYARMIAAVDSDEGNLLERTTRQEAAAQVAIITYALSLLPHPPAVVIEVGTNKALFGLLLTHMLPPHHPWLYLTCDVNPESSAAVALLDRSDRNVRGVFWHGDSREALPSMLAALDAPPDLAWVDGEHTEAATLAALRDLDAAGCPLILVDDVIAISQVHDAVTAFLGEAPYARLDSMLPEQQRGVAMLVRRRDLHPEVA